MADDEKTVTIQLTYKEVGQDVEKVLKGWVLSGADPVKLEKHEGKPLGCSKPGYSCILIGGNCWCWKL